jgi:hypothetical protein
VILDNRLLGRVPARASIFGTVLDRIQISVSNPDGELPSTNCQLWARRGAAYDAHYRACLSPAADLASKISHVLSNFSFAFLADFETYDLPRLTCWPITSAQLTRGEF